MSKVTELLATLMRLEGFTQAQLAEKSGLHRSNLCRFLAGETDIRMSSLVALLSALDVNFEELLHHEIKRRLAVVPHEMQRVSGLPNGISI